jgi:predicted acetyltransferase
MNDRVVGFVCVLSRLESEDIIERDREHAYVTDLVVLEPYRNAGIASELMRVAEAHAFSAGARRLRVGVLAANRGAHNLYRRLGSRSRDCSRKDTRPHAKSNLKVTLPLRVLFRQRFSLYDSKGPVSRPDSNPTGSCHEIADQLAALIRAAGTNDLSYRSPPSNSCSVRRPDPSSKLHARPGRECRDRPCPASTWRALPTWRSSACRRNHRAACSAL